MATSNYIPANQNALLLPSNFGGFTNQTIFQTDYPIFYNVSTHVNLSILPDNLASLTFNSSDPTIALAFGLSGLILDSDAIRMITLCLYPLSGAYDTLSRILFYILMVFSLVFQRYEKITMAALGTAMTYAAVTAVHALALVTQFSGSTPFSDFTFNVFSTQKYVDPDIYGAFPILAISAIMLTPILMWSTTVRTHNGQAIIIFWGILILIALSAVVGKILKENDDNDLAGFVPSFALCNNASAYCRSFAAKLLASIPIEVYDTCGCMDFCGTMSPSAPMRRGANMVAWSTHGPTGLLDGNGFIKLIDFGIPIMAFVCVSGIFGILASQWGQEDMRNNIFIFLNDRKKNRTNRKTIAKYVAATVFLAGILVTVLAPFVFILTVTTFELYLLEYPQSEHNDAVGAWGTCVGAALVVLAAIASECQSLCAYYFRTILRFPQNRGKLENESTEPKPWLLRQREIKFSDMYLVPIEKVKMVVKNFVSWWKDPEKTCEERQLEKEKERKLTRELKVAKIKHEEEVARLRHEICGLQLSSDLSLKGHGQQVVVHDLGNSSVETIAERNLGNHGVRPLFYDRIQPYTTLSSISPANQTYTPVTSRYQYIRQDTEHQTSRVGHSRLDLDPEDFI